jgi:hypothetical protein
MKQTARIENWNVIEGALSSFMYGQVFDHPNEELNGEYAYTSKLVSLDEEMGIAETNNTVYTLGKKANESVQPSS